MCVTLGSWGNREIKETLYGLKNINKNNKFHYRSAIAHIILGKIKKYYD